MKKLISILCAVLMLFTCAIAEETNDTVTGEAEQMMNAFLNEIPEPSVGTVTVTLDANITTGYEWTAFVIGGDSVVIDDENSCYVPDSNPDLLDGVGGAHIFILNAVQPGESIVRFTYARGWDASSAEYVYLLFSVDEDLCIYTLDVTETGVYDGIVTAVDEQEHAVVLLTERMGEVIARFDENEMLPVEGEHIQVYTNGVATMSLPAIVNVIAWSTVPGEQARTEAE